MPVKSVTGLIMQKNARSERERPLAQHQPLPSSSWARRLRPVALADAGCPWLEGPVQYAPQRPV